MIIALFTNIKKTHSSDISRKILDYLNSHGVAVVSEPDVAEAIGAKALASVDPAAIDYVISLGGDGTILRLTHRHTKITAPIMAINLGSLGFLADITVEEIQPSLKNLLEGNFTIQNRIVMDGVTKNNDANFAVNEIVIHRAGNPCLVDLAMYVDDLYLNTFSADGIIISTASGSTAYSMAAGGPILTPDLNAFVITPICPHTISNRPIVLLPEKEIRVEYISQHDPVEITYDGFPHSTISTGETLVIKRSQRKFRLVCMPNHDYYATLRTKLGWAGKLKAER